MRHDRQVVWLNHRMREYYDLWDQFSGGLSARARLKEGVRRAIIHRADRHFLLKAQRRFVISATVQRRLQRWGNIPSDVLYPPAMVGTAMELTAAAIFNQVPVHGTYTLDATLITKENAKNYYFPDSPF